MAGSSERVPVRDIDTEAEKAREAVEKAKAEYLAALTNTESSAEVKELLKIDYIMCAQVAKTAAEAALLAKRQRAERSLTPRQRRPQELQTQVQNQTTSTQTSLRSAKDHAKNCVRLYAQWAPQWEVGLTSKVSSTYNTRNTPTA